MWNHAKDKFKVGKKTKSIKEKCDRLGHYEFTYWLWQSRAENEEEKRCPLFFFEKLCLLTLQFIIVFFFVCVFIIQNVSPYFHCSLAWSTTVKTCPSF